MPSAAATPAPSVSAAAPPVADKRPPPPLPKLDTKELDEELSILATLCQPAVRRDEKGKQWVGCVMCLSQPDPQKAWDGTVVVDPPEGLYAARSINHGSFTRPGADEIAISMDGCESHAENYGGILVVEKRGAGFVWVRYDSGVHPELCLRHHRKDGHDGLVCRWQDGHQGHWHDLLYTYDFERATPDHIDSGFDAVVGMNDDSKPGCMGVEPGQDVRSGRIESFELLDEDGDGEPELVVEVSQIRGKPNKAYAAACVKWEETVGNDGPPLDVAAAIGKRRKARLVYSFDGKTFVPTKATEKIVSTL